MKNSITRRQRPLFNDGPDWQQLDAKLRQQLVQQLANICHDIVTEPSSTAPPRDQAYPHDTRKD